ncbi:hypothetical protein G6W61_27980 [Streptomyces sp. KAI-26]|uniref:hypothetical protein n=1 Tax=Streptomyces TaxID=1883 RepID=UPI000A095EEE|nr:MULTISPECIES: hypothetical protein [unclassified Streptomyces]ARI54600.1 hypothetical protein A6E92_22320 [Streptomyces sp. S8]NUV90003.1 hypothetical protein [Streptomyces sp. KAI-26]NUW24017.1 hypothetical protein [Streptomyces roseoviolaceus]
MAAATGLIATEAKYGPGSLWSTHSWVMDAYWGDSCWFCSVCDIPSYRDAAHEKCSGLPIPLDQRLPTAYLIAPKENH